VRISFDLLCPRPLHMMVTWILLGQVPFSLEDPDYKGLELDLMAFCEKHGKPSERLVAFEGTYTGRRFLACAEPVFFLPY
jgi:hypothetical protein